MTTASNDAFWYGQLDVKVGRDGSFKGAAKVVFMTLCTHADTKTHRCFLRVKSIAKESGYCERTVRSALHKLADMGVIDITERFSRESGSQTSSSYTIIGNRASCYQAYGSDEIPALLDAVMPIDEDIPPCKKLQEPPAKTCIHNESHFNESLKDSLTREAPLPCEVSDEIPEPEPEDSEPESKSESRPEVKTVTLEDVPAIMKPTAEYLLLKTGRKALTESELSALRTLSASHYPSRVQKEIDRTCERFTRKGKSLDTLTFNYIAGALAHQKSRTSTGRRKVKASKSDTSGQLTQAEIEKTQHTYTDSELDQIEAEFYSRR